MEEFVEEGLPTLKNPNELGEYIYKINRMSTVKDSFKAIMNSDILPQYKIECIQWYNSYYGSHGYPEVQKTQEFSDIPPERFGPMKSLLDANERNRTEAEAKAEKDYRTWQHFDQVAFSAAPAKAPTPPEIDAQTWTEWRKSKIGFGGKTRKSKSKRYAK